MDVLRIAQGLIFVLGAIVVYTALKGYARQKSGAMLMLALGFGFVTMGAVAAGILFELINADLFVVEAVQASSQVLGFVLIVYSLAGPRE